VKQVGIIESAMKEVVTDLKKRLEEKQNDR
jgi:hypothetical protein